jgi:hypothetical protein
MGFSASFDFNYDAEDVVDIRMCVTSVIVSLTLSADRRQILPWSRAPLWPP